jgi:hypothetical protein
LRRVDVIRGAALALVLATVAPSGALAQEPYAAWVDLVVHGVSAQAPRSWLDGGTGRFVVGEDPDAWQGELVGEAQAGLEAHPGDRFAAHLHLRARAQQDDRGDAAGVVEAWAQMTTAPREGSDRFRLRAGQLFIPTSRENVGPLWSSPYTFTLSAINSWIGEEVRPIGVLAEYETSVDATRGLRAGLSLFGGNDTSGALLAWRGWAMGDRLSTFGESLPLPALPSLHPDGIFARQDREGTTPIGGDLDGRPGWAAYLRFRDSEHGLVQLTHWDNRGDRALHDDEYAWYSEFDQLGLEMHPGVAWTLAGEYLTGDTAMGVPRTRAAADFHAAYGLASWQHGIARATVRFDDFTTRDRDHVAAGERSDEDGHAWTAALMLQASPRLSLGVEVVDLSAHRPALVGGGRRDDGGTSVTLGARYRVGSAG